MFEMGLLMMSVIVSRRSVTNAGDTDVDGFLRRPGSDGLSQLLERATWPLATGELCSCF